MLETPAGPPRPETQARPTKWWGRRWLATMQARGCVEKISRGKTYAKGGHVLSVAFAAGGASAHVQGSRWPPYEVAFRVGVLDELQWRRVIESLARRPVFAARLLAGSVPTDIEAVFEEAGLSLLPRDDISVTCTCPSEEASCKHIAAVCYVLADALEADPFQLFVLRGRTRAQLLAALRPDGPPAEERNLPSDPHAFWSAAPLAGFEVDRGAPPTPMAVVQRLGAPAMLGSEPFLQALTPLYDVVGRQAGRIIGD